KIHVHQRIKGNGEVRATFRAGGYREIERILRCRQCRQLRNEVRDQHIIQHLDLGLEAFLHQEPVVVGGQVLLGKSQLFYPVQQGRSDEHGGKARSRGGIGGPPLIRVVQLNHHICSNLQTRDNNLGGGRRQRFCKTEHLSPHPVGCG